MTRAAAAERWVSESVRGSARPNLLRFCGGWPPWQRCTGGQGGGGGGASGAARRVAAFDLDDTLIKTRSGLPGYRRRDARDWRWLEPETPVRLRALEAEGMALAVLTNQNGIRGAHSGKAALKFRGVVEALAADLGVPLRVFAATQKDSLRKGMGVELWREYEHWLGAPVDLAGSFFVGDAAGRARDHSDVDAAFARQAGLRFHTEEEFHGMP